MHSENLFTNYSQIENNAPLADKLRPKNLEDFFGQQPILNENSLLRSAILNDKISNFIFSGPPGVGKTTLIEIISFNTRSKLIKLNAVLSSVKELRNEIANAKDRLINSKRKTILFIDEVHRFTSVQQDALLPSIENGTITFIGATTVYLTQDAISHLVKFSGGDARTLINALEMAIETTAENEEKEININLSIAEDAIQKKNIVYDKNGQNHYDVISAFIKSIRGSDPDATLFWLANMLEAGEDPNFIFRRLLISASEDIGIADPNAIVVVQSCCDAFDRVGFPEGLYFLTQASLYLAISPKSNSTKSIFKAIETIKSTNAFDVPLHLKNNSNSYVNPHNYPGNWVAQEYLPKSLRGLKIWEPNNNGWEKTQYEELLRRKEN